MFIKTKTITWLTTKWEFEDAKDKNFYGVVEKTPAGIEAFVMATIIRTPDEMIKFRKLTEVISKKYNSLSHSVICPVCNQPKSDKLDAENITEEGKCLMCEKL
jgi:hypothetical protein